MTILKLSRAQTLGCLRILQGRFRLDRRKTFFIVKVVRQWNRLLRHVMEALSLETFKVRLDQPLSTLT